MIQRSIKSYVTRNGRLSNGQKKLLETYLPSYKLNLDNSPKLPNNSFENCTLEIGFGRGDILIHLAKNNPDKNFIGVETYLSGISIILRKSIDNNLSNVKNST